MDRIKRLSMEVLENHKGKFGVNFSDNKKILDEVTIIRSKGLKNEIAGYITKSIKHEMLDKKKKEEQIAKQTKLEQVEEEPKTSKAPVESEPSQPIQLEQPETSQ